uniref:Uncharacterized protein n=1 Tax=Rhizophora mucronata TaxID=61149 RepID=A0A2P2PY83_RHIMU
MSGIFNLLQPKRKLIWRQSNDVDCEGKSGASIRRLLRNQRNR